MAHSGCPKVPYLMSQMYSTLTTYSKASYLVYLRYTVDTVLLCFVHALMPLNHKVESDPVQTMAMHKNDCSVVYCSPYISCPIYNANEYP